MMESQTETRTAAVQRQSEEVLMPNYRRAAVAFARGEGVRLYDLEGRVYLDFVGGIAVSSLGHAHPRLVRAIQEQAARLLHVSNLYLIPEQTELAQWLTSRSGLDRAFFCNSGAEANEAAIKLARRFHYTRGTGRYEIIVAEHAFHGRTLATLAATPVAKYQEGFSPLPEGFRVVPFNDPGALVAAVNERTGAIMLEPVQGEAGVFPATAEFLAAARALCDAHRLLLIFDEVQTGIGRTGTLFAFQGSGVKPDVITLAKGLGGGVPIGAVLARAAVAEVFQPGAHGSTFGGNPLACAAALAVVQTVEEENLAAHAAAMGEILQAGLRELGHHAGAITAVRGRGLLVGADLDREAAPLVDACRARGLLVNGVQPRTLRLAPPLIVSAAEIREALAILEHALADVRRASLRGGEGQ
ncbi:MAG: N-acetylornithine aminotransferase, acetylornithine aminotransferase [Armatimonadetes bacterium CSP1-3]|nr:MAG: N-acetylornithine aminotransferase, acetylornithine aminotransferase [Armatimonadetes bacterium CSP1-3]